MPISVEATHKAWDNKTGERVEVGYDADGLDLVVVRSVDSDGKVVAEFTITEEMAAGLIICLRRRLHQEKDSPFGLTGDPNMDDCIPPRLR